MKKKKTVNQKIKWLFPNTEVLDSLKKRFEEIENRLQNPYIKIIRCVEPKDDTFKEVQGSIKELLQQNFPKERGSNHLVTTVQGLYIVAETEGEEQKTKILEQMGLHPAYDEGNEILSAINADISGVSKLFSNNPKSQRVIYNSEFNPTVSLDGLNDYVTKFKIEPLDYGMDKLHSNHSRFSSRCPSRGLFNFIEEESYICPVNNDDNYWDILTNFLDVDENLIEVDDYETNDKRINSIDPSILFANLSKLNYSLDTVNTQIDAYMDEVSITYSEFCKVFPKIDAILENEVRKDQEETLRKSQLKRRFASIAITTIHKIELDVSGDEDIESLVSELYLENKKRIVSGDVFSRVFNHDKDYFRGISSKFDGVSVIDIQDTEEDLKDAEEVA